MEFNTLEELKEFIKQPGFLLDSDNIMDYMDIAYYIGCNDGEDVGYKQSIEENYKDDGYDGYDAGYENGSEEGYNEGRSEGYEEGYNVGLVDGNNNGYDNGYDAGLEDGRREGHEDIML